MYRFYLYIIIFSFCFIRLEAQSYEMSPDFMQQLSSDSFAQSIMVLTIDDMADGDYTDFELSVVRKLQNLRELNLKPWVYGKKRDTSYIFNGAEKALVRREWDRPLIVNPMDLLSMTHNWKNLEVLTISFDEKPGWHWIRDYYKEELIKELIKDLVPCLRNSELGLSGEKLLENIAESFDWKPLEFFRSPWNKMDGVPNCLPTKFYEKWKDYMLYEKGVLAESKYYTAHCPECIEMMYPPQEFKKKQQSLGKMPRISLELEFLKDRSRLLPARMRALGIAALSPAEQLASKLVKLPNLKVLEISDYPNLEQELPQLFKALAKLPKFEILKITNCQLRKIPKEITLLKSLKALYLNQNELNLLDGRLAQLENLELLDLSDNPIQEYKEGFYQISTLKELYIHNCKTYPKKVGDLRSLEILSIQQTPVLSAGELSKELMKLSGLTHLYLNAIGLTEWPETIQYLRNLRELEIKDNELQTWPANFASWPEMKIDVRKNFLPPVPEKVVNEVYWEEYKPDLIRYFPLKENQWQEVPKAVLASENYPMESFCLSKFQDVYLHTDNWEASGKDFDFSGQLYLPYAKVNNTKGHFEYYNYRISIDQKSEIQLYLPCQKRIYSTEIGEDEYDFKEVSPTSIYKFRGELLIDNPENKFKQWTSDQITDDWQRRPNRDYPVLRSLDTTYVYYPNYDSTAFYAALAPFELVHLDSFSPTSLVLNANVHTAGITDPLTAKLVWRNHDLSLGFEQLYKRLKLYPKNSTESIFFSGLLDLSNTALMGRGDLFVGNWTAHESHIRFEEDRILIDTKEFVPERGKKKKDVQLLYFPKEDKLLISENQLPFSLWSVANDQMELDEGILKWPIPSSCGKHFVELSQIKETSTYQFDSDGELAIYCYLPLALANIILEDLDAATLEELDKEEAAFIFNNLKMKWDTQKRLLLSEEGEGFSQKIRLNAVAGQIVDRPLEVEIKISPAEKGDRFEWYFEKTDGNWYYFSLMNNEIETLSSNENYNEAVQTLKKKERWSKLPKRQKFEVKLAEKPWHK